MRSFLLPAILALFITSCSRIVYVVRHAEKVTSDSAGKMMANDPPLSEAGKVRALVLKEELINKHIRHIYSTKTIRTMATAEPLSRAIKIDVEPYGNIDSLVNTIKSTKGNVLVVGHSNTVDDIVNKLCGQLKIATDLNDKEYDNLFVVTIKGKRVILDSRKYGYPSNP